MFMQASSCRRQRRVYDFRGCHLMIIRMERAPIRFTLRPIRAPLSSVLFYSLLTTFLVPFSLLYTFLHFSTCLLSHSLLRPLALAFELILPVSQPVCQRRSFDSDNMFLMSAHKSGHEHLHSGTLWQRRGNPVQPH